MFPKVKIFLFIFLTGIVGFVGWNAYNYFFDSSRPVISLAGIESGKAYCGDVQCCVTGSDDYKISIISIWLDGKEPPLVSRFKVSSKSFEYPFVLPTRTLTPGKHSLKIEAIDGSFSKNKTVNTYDFCVDNVPLQAAFVKQDGDFKTYQGKTLHIQFQVNKPIDHAVVHVLSDEFPCFPESKGSPIYECFVPVKCEERPNEYPLTVEIVDAVGNTLSLDNKFQVIPFQFKRMKLNMNSEKAREEREIGLPQSQLNGELVELCAKSPKEKLWNGGFDVPAEMQGVATAFGAIRVTQEKGKYTHAAVDLLAMPKSVVWAPQAGIVVVKDRYGESGNTIVIDHGCGVFSLLFHLDSLADVNVGDKVRKGAPVGTVGKTGYSTGYHLHWEMRVNNVQVDPFQWTKDTF